MTILKSHAAFICWKRRKGRAILRWISFEKNGFRAVYDSKSKTDMRMVDITVSNLNTHPYIVYEPPRLLDYDTVMHGESMIPCEKCGFPVSIKIRRLRRIPDIEQTDVCPICGTKNLSFVRKENVNDGGKEI